MGLQISNDSYSLENNGLRFNILFIELVLSNKLVSQMQAPLATCREPAGKLWQLCKVLYVFF